MSFVISAIYENAQLFMASDTKLVSASGKQPSATKSKIFRVSDRAIIGVAGMYAPGFKITKDYQSQYQQTWTFSKAIEELRVTMIRTHKYYKANIQADIDCSIMLGYQEQETPRIALLTLAKGTVQVFQEPLRAGRYQFFFANPDDYSFDNCLRLCQTRFLLAGDTRPVNVLNSLVLSVAAHSEFVNDKPECWLVGHGKQAYIPPINEFLDQFKI